MTLVKQT